MSSIARDGVADSLAIDPHHPIAIVAPEDLWIEGDAEKITQVVANLLANVRAHTHPETNAVIDVRRDNGNVVIEVRDYWPGVPTRGPRTCLRSLLSRRPLSIEEAGRGRTRSGHRRRHRSGSRRHGGSGQ